MKYYLSYGMNCDAPSMAARCPTAVKIGVLIVPGWKLITRTHCDIVEYKDSKLYGLLWEIQPSDEQALDYLEGYPTYYTKVMLDTKIGPVMAYKMTEDSAAMSNKPFDSYVDFVRLAYIEAGLPVEQLDESY